MNRFPKTLLTAAATMLLGSGLLYAQTPPQQSATPAPQTSDVSGADTHTAPTRAFPENAPLLEGSQQRYILRRVNVHGVKYLNHQSIKSSAGLIEGDSIYLPSNYIGQAISRLWDRKLFSDVKMGATIEGDSVDLELFLTERPRVYDWKFEGITKGKQKDLMEQLKLRRGTELSDYVIDKNKRLIQAYWADKGFRNAEVDVRIENDSLRPNVVNVTFVIDRKSKVRVGAITFSGNNTFTDKRLRRTFKKTHQTGINFFHNTKLKEDDYADDKELLIDFYNSRGYRNATILRDSIYTINEKRIGLHLDLSEGEKFYIRNVTWVGNSVYDTDYLQKLFGFKRGDTYDKKSMHTRLGVGKEDNPENISVHSLYQNEGYLASQIEPSEIIVGRDSIDLEIKVFEGRPFTINDVIISGNNRLDDEIIRRELYTRPGDLYNRALLMQTLRTLAAMNQFNAEALMPDIQPVSNDLVNIGFPLEETASDQFNIAGGWGSGTFVGSVGITLNNLSIKNFFKKGAWSPYPMGQNQRLNISAQTNGTYYKAFSLSFTDPWLGGRKPNSFTLSTYFSEQTDAYYVWQKGNAYFRTFGVAAGLGKRLEWPDPNFTLYTELTYERYSLKDWNYFIMKNGSSNLFSLKFVFGRSSVDQPLYPRRGSEFSTSVQVTPPYSLWDGKDYTDPTLSDHERYKWIEFHKWQFKVQWFQALSQNSNLVLMAKAEMGYLGNYNRNKVSPFQRFEVGGDGMSGYNVYGIDIIGMRGYEDGALDPTSQYSCAYNKYTVELRYPLIMKPSSTIYVLGFLEGGNGFSSWSDFSPFKIKRSAGVGVRLYLPVVGMLGIDWGYGFDHPNQGDTTKPNGSKFSFVIGQQF